MKYYSFKEACATKETGSAAPQIQKWKPGYNDDAPDSYYTYYEASSRGRTFPDFVPDFDALVMHGRAKPTDLVSSVLSIGFFVNQKLKTVFEQCKFPPHRFYPAKVVYKKAELEGYYFMHIISNYYEDYLDSVDYTQSVFFTGGFSKNNPQYIIITSKKDYIDKSAQLQTEFSLNKLDYRAIYAEKIYFNSKFDISLDFFCAPFGTNCFISQNLKNAITENGITGCNIQSTNKIFFD